MCVRVKSDFMYNESFARLVILYAALVTSLHSCIVHPCHMVPHCPLLQCQPLLHRADLSTPANSIPATWCRIVHSCIFHTPIFDRAALSTPANSINPILCHLGYCNSPLCGVTDNLLQHLQSVQNAAAWLVTGVRRRDHITPVLRQLHWLPVRLRFNFKLAVFVYQALLNTTAQYLVEDCQLVSNAGRRQLRSADVDTCIVPLTRTRLGDRSFSVAGPRLWNSLPALLCQPDVEIGQFRRLLKTFLFARDCGA